MRTRLDEIRLRRFEQPRAALVFAGARGQQGRTTNLDPMRRMIIDARLALADIDWNAPGADPITDEQLSTA